MADEALGSQNPENVNENKRDELPADPSTIIEELRDVYAAWRSGEDLPPSFYEIDAALDELVGANQARAMNYITALFESGDPFLRTKAGILCARLAASDRAAADRLWERIRLDAAVVVETSLVVEELISEARIERPHKRYSGESASSALDVAALHRFWEQRILPDL